MSGCLEAHGVAPATAHEVANLPPVSILFAAFLGYNPVERLLGPTGALDQVSDEVIAAEEELGVGLLKGRQAKIRRAGIRSTGPQAAQVGLDTHQLAAGLVDLQHEVRWNVALGEAPALRFEHTQPALEGHGELFQVINIFGYIGHN